MKLDRILKNNVFLIVALVFLIGFVGLNANITGFSIYTFVDDSDQSIAVPVEENITIPLPENETEEIPEETTTEIPQDEIIKVPLENITIPLNETPIIENITEIPFENMTISVNETFLSIKTDKSRYLVNEGIRIFGEVLINGEKVNTKAILEIKFNGNKIFTTESDVMDGEYEYILKEINEPGEYLAIISVDDFSNQAIFYVELGQMEYSNCKEFEENVLWSSGFTHNSKGSITYETWTPKFTCNEAGGQNCFLQDVSVSSRTVYTSPDDKEINGKGYIQISNLDRAECNSPEKGVYSTYLAYESVKGVEGIKKGWYCGYDKEESEDLIKFKPQCGIKFTEKLASNSGCYGIKAYAPQSTIIDAFKIKYKLCWEQDE